MVIIANEFTASEVSGYRLILLMEHTCVLVSTCILDGRLINSSMEGGRAYSRSLSKDVFCCEPQDEDVLCCGPQDEVFYFV